MFDQIRKKIDFYTAVDDERLKLIYRSVTQTMGLGAYMAEIGVYKGGSGLLMALSDPDRVYIGVDTFEGLPEPTNLDRGTVHVAKDFADTDLEAVRKKFTEAGVGRFHLIKGKFPNGTINTGMERVEYSLVHIDVDLYEATIESLVFFWNRLVKGGVIVVDDYGWKDTPGVKKAVDAFLKAKPGEIPLTFEKYKNSCRIIKV